MGCSELSSCCCGEIGIPLELDGYIRESLVLPKEGNPLVVHAVECGIALVPMHLNQASS